MFIIRNPIFALLLCSALVASMAGAAKAQSNDELPKVGDRIGDWSFDCRALSASETVCALTQSILESKTKRQVLQLALRRVGEKKTLVLFALVPLGVYLPSGVAGKVDEGKQFPFIWQTCTQRGCEAIAQVDDSLKAALKGGEKLLIGFKARPTAKTIAVAASLKGISQGLQALGEK